MLKHQDIRFDKIILCGSIVTKSFEWDLLFRRNQIQFVRNEYSKNDKVVDLSWLLSLNNSGSTGKKGFMESGSFFEEKEFEYFDHGSYFEGNHMNEFWLPFLIKEPPRFQLIVGKDVPSITAFTKYFDQTEMIDVDCYGKDPYWEKYHIPDDLAENWADTNPDIYSFLSKDEKSKEIIGYINAMPLKDEIFHQLLEGTVHDNEIKPSDIVPFNGIKKELNLYIMSIALKPSYQKTHLGLRDLGFEKLFSSLIEKLIEYYKRYQVKINCVAAIGWTEKGIQLCEMFGMKYTGKNELVTNKPIYLLELNNPDNIFIHKSVRKLVMIYNGKGSE
jgi:hypothetical protein